MRRLLSSRWADSRIHSGDVQKSERLLGHFSGPAIVYTVYAGVAGVYLTQFYTDVLGLGGWLLTLMPLLSKLLSSASSFFIGRLIDRTCTPQGKARPYLPAAGLLLAVCGGLLYAVPRASWQIQTAWVVVSYNLFFSLAFSLYSMSHSLMVPLSTRSEQQRDGLALLSGAGTSMLPGMLTTIVMPLLVQHLGAGADAQPAWLIFMSVLSILALPAALVEYYFTRERISAQAETRSEIPFRRQIGACLSDRRWMMIAVYMLILHLITAISSGSVLYYSNWVLASSIEGGASRQILVNAVGQFPMGLGVAALWPLVRRFGRRRVSVIGFSVAALGSLAVLLAGKNLPLVLAALFLRSCGSLPTYLMAALLAESLDHIEKKHGFRADGFSAAAAGIVQSAAVGLAQTILLGGIQLFGYTAPASAAQLVLQPESVQLFFRCCFAGVPMAGYAICAVILFCLKEKETGEDRA